MKIFVSHKDSDSDIAVKLCGYLKSKNIQTYIDVLDNNIEFDGERLTRHLKAELSRCTHLLTVLSESTKISWWVPFEIGMAAQIDIPIANYLVEGIELPGYLDYWPRLRKLQDMEKYILALLKSKVELNKSYGYITESYSGQFHKYLKSIL